MCAKVRKALTSFQPTSFLYVWDPIFGLNALCMMYYLPYIFLLRMAGDLRYMLGHWYLYSYAYMVFGF